MAQGETAESHVDGARDPAGASSDANRTGFAGKRRGNREIFWNLPNTVTMLRIAVVPVLFFIPTPWAQTENGSQFMAWAFIIAALSDLLDGWLARRAGGVGITKVGKLLDPLADKLLVCTALVMLVAIGRIPVWASGAVVIIIGRELAVTGLRGLAGSDGHVVGASWQGKLKSFVQNFSVGALIFHYPTFGLPAHELGLTLLMVAAALTSWSGYVYFADYFGWRHPGAQGASAGR